MRILDRYILKSVLGVFFTCLLTFLLLYVIVDVFSNLEDILKHQVKFNILTQYYFSYLPIIFVRVSPIACLLATLYTFANLNRNNEIIAMRSSGLSIFGISKTVIIFGVIISIFVFLVNDKFVPKSLSLNKKIKEQMEVGVKKEKAKEQHTITNLSMYGFKNRLFFISKFSPNTNTMEGIIILEHDENQNIIKKVVANKGVYEGRFWRFYQSITYNFNESGQILNEPQYEEEEIMPISETPHDFLEQRQLPEVMTIAQLDDYIWKLSRSGATTVIRNLKVDLYQRFTEPLTSILIVLIGIPFSLMIRKRATGLSSLGVSIMVGFLYYVLNAISIALGKSGALAPALAVSLSHILIFGYSMALIHTLP